MGAMYGYCGPDQVLEAAHRHGRTVAEGNYFDMADGVCLCANHHRLYDKGHFEIGFSNLRLVGVAPACANSLCARLLRDHDGKVAAPHPFAKRTMQKTTWLFLQLFVKSNSCWPSRKGSPATSAIL